MKRFLFTVTVSALMSGCASFTGNTTQPIVIATTCGDKPVQGASCRVINANGSWTVPSTPGSVMIRKASSDLAIDCKLDKAQAMPLLSESVAGPGVWGNLLLGGIIGFGVDTGRDAAWRYDTEFTVDMCKGVPMKTAASIQGAAGIPALAGTSASPSAEPMTTVGDTGQMRFLFSAEAMAKQQQCTNNPRAVLNARGPATEVYTVACNSGNTLMLKCTFGDCKMI